MISSLISRECCNKKNILWIPSNNIYFEKWMHNLDCVRLFYSDHLYIGSCVPDIIITNNKINNSDAIVNLCHYHKCNLIIIDHDSKSDIVDTDKVQKKFSTLPNVYYVAMSEKIKQSWGDMHDLVLNYNANDSSAIICQIIDDITQKRFIYE